MQPKPGVVKTVGAPGSWGAAPPEAGLLPHETRDIEAPWGAWGCLTSSPSPALPRVGAPRLGGPGNQAVEEACKG